MDDIPLYVTAGSMRTIPGTSLRAQEHIALVDYGKPVDRFDVIFDQRGATAWCGDTTRPAIRAMRRRFVEVRYG